MTYKIFWEERGVVTQYSGYTTDREVALAVRAIKADARFDRLLYQIHDFLPCESYAFSESTVAELAAIDWVAAQSLHKRQMAVAVVTDRQDVTASVNAYLGSGFNLQEARIFSSIADARLWLSREPKIGPI